MTAQQSPKGSITAGLIWCTYRKDFDWFQVSVKSYKKFASGFHRAVCVVPSADVSLFMPICNQYGIQIISEPEWPDKPFMWHQYMICKADVLMPDCDWIYHIDADCVFAQPCTPEDWNINGKILMPYEPYEKIRKRAILPGEAEAFLRKDNPIWDYSLGAYNWKFAVEHSLGFEVTRECMTWSPIIHHRAVYEILRRKLNERWPEQWDGHIRGGRDKHPQTVAEFPMLGAVAHKCLESFYEWRDITVLGHLFLGKVIQNWSHGGFDRTHDYGEQVKHLNLAEVIATPRKLFKALDLL